MKVWKFISGYVNIRMMGEYPEKVVNRLLEDGTPVANCRRTAEGLSCGVRPKDFKKLRTALRGSGVRFSVGSKRGAPFMLKALRRNAVLTVSAILAAAVIAFLSTRLWFIRIEAPSFDGEELTAMLSELGVRRGAALREVRTGDISAALNADPRITNAKAVLKGVTLTLTLAENHSSVPELKKDPSSGIYADKDCVVREISVTGGHACVAPGAAVKKGDTLITGDLSASKEGLLVNAEGTVIGEVLYAASATAPGEYEELVPSGRSALLRSLTVFGREIMPEPPFSEYSLEPVRETKLTYAPLPVTVREYLFTELVPETIPDSLEGTELRARLSAQEKLKALLPEQARIITVRTDCVINGDGSATAVITVTALEEIGRRRTY